MPGTIQVSVLDFKNISSSAQSSSICLWVSMGKRAYQTWDKGDFSFPLTTFRENLVVRLQDAEGNEISRAEVQTLSIVEKGYWDDFFQLEGGDYVHMKLQFILSEDERNRIRNVRESALKKKQYIVPATNVEYKGTTIPVGDTFASSLPIRRKFSGESAVHLLEDCHIGVDDHQRNKKPPKQEITRKRGFFHKSDSTIKKGEEKPQKPRKSQSESSGQNGPSGPIRQVIKIAVIVGFGILVLLTRQKETRRNDRKSKEFYFASPDFIDQLASSEEKWSLLTAEGN